MTTLAQPQPKTLNPGESTPTNNLQRFGGLSGIAAGATWIFGFALFLTALAPLESGGLNGVEKVAFLGENQAIFYTWNLVIYIFFGFFQAILTLAIHERLKGVAPATSQIAATLGLIWSGLVIASGMTANIGVAAATNLYAADPTQAGTVWLAVETVVDGIGGGNEIVGGLWVLLLSWAAMRGGLPKALNVAGIVFGLAGFITTVPMLKDAGMLFGLGLIVWYIWAGIVLLLPSRQ